METQRSGAPIDVGTAYEMPPSSHDAFLTEVGRGTPCGEFMRRYWQPVAVSRDVTDTPQQVRILGEDLILFRDKSGRPGLVHPRCAHRGTTLYYGKVEERGIRCCYHGWLFDVEGRCLEQPCEPNLGEGHREKVRQPWYPTADHYGLVFAYMGPPEKKPLLPKFDIFENLQPHQYLLADDSGLGTGGNGPHLIAPCNWLQHWENIMDSFHVAILHSAFSGTQFVPEMAVMPVGEWEYVPRGVRFTGLRKLEGGRTLRRITEVMFPNLRVVASPILKPGPIDHIGFTVPVDDTHYRIFNVMIANAPGEKPPRGSLYDGKPWSELTEEEHRRLPGDWEAQVGQGPITFHSDEHLATTDRGVVMCRRMLAQQIKVVQEGGDPLGVAYDPADQVVKLEAGNFFE
ncbi:MAG TPA: aromatic ring-hydroxylating dioxygenase subunit alpha [Hyphomicrobiales bacterium]|nr:aromatic ring-hydroxylating dioxygenase subunit alpha [Hyphomicrobiales bacterium]